jgi:tRNA dimethylallyltransferase
LTGIKKIRVPVLLGPTASGKSAVALTVCERLSCDIVSCDSRQIYKKMDIGTAKPSAQERNLVRHWMIDIIDPDTRYSSFSYAQDALSVIREMAEQGRRVLLCGGTGLYYKNLSQGIGHQAPENPALRQKYRTMAQDLGAEAVFAELYVVDPVTAETSHVANLQRNIRALEVYHTTGIPLSRLKSGATPPGDIFFDVMVLSLPRQQLYSRINARVDEMVCRGLWDEFKELRKQGYDSNSPGLLCVGYRELFDVEENRASLAQAVEKIKQNTRNYAKRQITWFRHQVSGRQIEVADTTADTVTAIVGEFFINKTG